MSDDRVQARRWRASPPVLLALASVSGAIALADEVLWTRELLNLLGSTTRASALVLAAFMAALALGACAAGRWTVGSRRPLWLFAAAEAALGCAGLAFPYALQYAASRIGIGAVLDAMLLVLLSGPALLMGIALPALAAALQRHGADRPKDVAALYGFNALGGAAAALGVGLLALPGLGLAASERAVAVAGLFLAAIAWALPAREAPAVPAKDRAARAGGSDVPSPPMARVGVLAALILGGVAALGYEVLWTRILVLVVGSSSVAFALMLGLYLLGLALGGFAMSRSSLWEGSPARTLQVLQLAVALTAVLGAAAFGRLPSAALFGFAWLGTSTVGILAVDILVIAAIIVPTAALIGASFPVAARLLEEGKPRRGREVGLALGITTLGNVGGILLAAFAIIPAAGLRGGVAALALINALAALVLWLAVRRKWPARLRVAVPGGALIVGLAAASLPPWDVAVMTSGVFRQAPVYLALLGGAAEIERAFAAYETRYYHEGTEAVVAVFDRPTLTGAPHRVLTIDGKVDASTGADMATQVLSGHLPFLFRPEARKVLVIGLASGVTAGAVGQHAVTGIDVVEIEPAVVQASRAFDGVSGAPLDNPRVRLTKADGRRFLAESRDAFDVIVSEPSNPWLSMSARLFTREFFALSRARLGAEGVLVQWIPLYGLSGAQFQALLRTLLEVFPHVALFRVAEGDLVALAGARPLVPDADGLARLFSGEVASRLGSIGVEGPADLLARWMADGQGLRAVLEEGPLNTDDSGLLEFGSPWYLLAETKPANVALLAKAGGGDVAAQVARALLRLADGREGIAALGERYLRQGRVAALRSLARALRAEGHEEPADLLLGDALAAEGRWSEAQDLWARHGKPPFQLRLAWAAFNRGEAETAARLFASVPEAERGPRHDIAFALALAGTGRRAEALAVLEARSAPPETPASVLTPFVTSVLMADAGRPAMAKTARRRFDLALDRLRRCLEAEECQGTVDGLVRWSEGGLPGLDARHVEALEQAVLLRITRPIPHYFEAVRHLWLGNGVAAAKAFRTYLDLLPDPDPLSKAHGFLAGHPPRVARSP